MQRLIDGAAIEIVPRGSAVANPAFDVTPRRYVTGLITERGVATPRDAREDVPSK